MTDNQISKKKRNKIRNSAFGFAIITSVILSVLKLSAGYTAGSLSIIAMGLDSFLDIIFTNVNFLALRMSDKPADEDHPLGHGKFEDFSTLVQASIIFLLGGFILYKGVTGFIDGSQSEFTNTAIVVMSIATIGSILISFVLKRAGKMINSSAMVADALHYTTDIATNGSILVGLIAAKLFDLYWMDSMLSAIFSLYIMYSAIKLFIEAFKVLTDYRIPEDIEDKVKEIINEHSDIIYKCSSFFAVKSGSHYVINFTITVCGSMTLFQSHEIADHIQASVEKKVPGSRVTIHVEPDFSEKNEKATLEEIKKHIREHGGMRLEK